MTQASHNQRMISFRKYVLHKTNLDNRLGLSILVGEGPNARKNDGTAWYFFRLWRLYVLILHETIVLLVNISTIAPCVFIVIILSFLYHSTFCLLTSN